MPPLRSLRDTLLNGSGDCPGEMRVARREGGPRRAPGIRRLQGLPMTAVLLVLCASACRSLFTLEESHEQEPAAVQAVAEPIVVAAWAEPPTLPEGGGQTQLLVRVQKKGGTPFPGVQVRLAASTGKLYSAGRILVTDGRGMTRDRLTTRRSARVVLNAGGTRYRFDVRVGDRVEATPPANGKPGAPPEARSPTASGRGGVSAGPRSPAPRSARRAAAVPSR